jgi:hypothetical protein
VKLVGRVPVQPLSDERWTNIERKVVAGAADAMAAGRRESRWGVLAFAAVTVVLVAGAGLVGWKLRGGGEPPVVAEVAPLTIESSDKATTLDIGDAKIASELGTSYVITRPGSGVVVAMQRGKVSLEVGKRGDRDPLIVRAGETDVIVVGTQFTVDFDGHDNVDVRVTEGKVKVVRGQKQDFVAAGFAWQSTRGVIALAEAGPSGAPVAAAKREDVVIPTGKDIALHDRTSKVPDSRMSINPKPNIGDRGGSPEVVRPLAPPMTPHAQLELDAKVRLNAAFAVIKPVVSLGNVTPAAAVSNLREQSLKTGPEASAAFYSIAVLQATKLGRTADAITTLDAYVRRFRGGAEYKAALWLRVVIKCRQAIDDHCRQAAFTYAHEDPGSTQGDLASVLSTMTSE